jgi:hypothetical protein
MRAAIILFCLLLGAARAFDRAPVNSYSGLPKSVRDESFSRTKKNVGLIVGGSLAALVSTRPFIGAARAAAGGLKTSSLQESKAAVQTVKKCLDGVNSMEALASKGDYEGIAKIASGAEFQDFEKAATVLVRSEALSADEKVALGTIKRYGLVADAIIMIGGLGGELKAGGIKMAAAATLQKGIEEDEGDEEEETEQKLRVNGPEVRRFIKLSKDALSDVYKIVAPISNK